MTVINFFFTRHGETQWNKIGKFQGQLDSPLTEKEQKALKAARGVTVHCGNLRLQFKIPDKPKPIRRSLGYSPSVDNIKAAVTTLSNIKVDIANRLYENDPDILDSWWDAEKHLLAAKARLGVDSVLRPLIDMCYDEWESPRMLATDALAKFSEAKGGLNGVLNVLAPFSQGEMVADRLKGLMALEKSSEVKRWAMDTFLQLKPAEAFETLVAFLGNSDWHLSHKACCLLSDFHTDVSEPLTLLTSDASNERGVRLWAMASLLLGSNNPSGSLIKDLDEIFVPWGFECPEMVRDAIIAEHGLHYESFTDVRYIIEAALTKREVFDSERFREKLTERLSKAGITIRQIRDCGTYHGSGGGTFDVVDTDKGQFFACTIGPFITASDIIEHTTDSVSVNNSPSAMSQLKNIITSLGGLWLDNDLLDHEVPNLNIYFFGDREALTVRDLIFYWQD